MLVVNGWTVCAHPLFLDQLEKLTAAVDREKAGVRRPAVPPVLPLRQHGDHHSRLGER